MLPTGGRPKPEDAVSFEWPISAAILGLLTDAVASASKFEALAELALLPVVLIGLVTAVVWAIALSLAARRRYWKRAASVLAAAPAALLAMPGLWSAFDLASEARLTANYAGYRRQIAAPPEPADQRQARWDWGGNTTAITGGELNWLVYDATDTLPGTLASGQPWPDADRPWFNPDRFEPRAAHLWDHFYRVGEMIP